MFVEGRDLAATVLRHHLRRGREVLTALATIALAVVKQQGRELEELLVEAKELRRQRDEYKSYADAAREAMENLVDPVTGYKFFMLLSRDEADGSVSHHVTFGGPFDSYTLAERDDDDEQGATTFLVEHYDHDRGGWVEGCEKVDGVLLTDEAYNELLDAERAAEKVEELIQRSSLGTPGAQALRTSTPREQVDAVLRRAEQVAFKPTYNNADFYTADRDAERLCHLTPGAALEEAFDCEDFRRDVPKLIREHSPITLTAYVRDQVTEQDLLRHAAWYADHLLEQLDEDYGDPDGEPTSDEVGASLATAILPVIRDWVRQRYTVWRCHSVGTRTYSADEIEAILRDRRPGWFAPHRRTP